MAVTLTPASRLRVSDPEVNRVIQDIYDKLGQVQGQLGLTVFSKPGTFTLAALTTNGKQGSITVNASGQVTAFTPSS